LELDLLPKNYVLADLSLRPLHKSETKHRAQRTAHSAQRTAHSAQRTAHSAQRTAHSAQEQTRVKVALFVIDQAAPVFWLSSNFGSRFRENFVRLLVLLVLDGQQFECLHISDSGETISVTRSDFLDEDFDVSLQELAQKPKPKTERKTETNEWKLEKLLCEYARITR
jgi:hypothetical protein